MARYFIIAVLIVTLALVVGAHQAQNIKISPRVQQLLTQSINEGRSAPAIVALESAVLSHGLPSPENLRVALDMERIIAEQGAMPATIAVISGVICVGLDSSQMDILAQCTRRRSNESQQESVQQFPCIKVSQRDLADAVAHHLTGGTTVASTAILAAQVGIRIFATGGIGGVHRGFDRHMDVSADLRVLGRTPIMVVAAGAKSILDLPRTLEYLETEGVPVVGWKTNEVRTVVSSVYFRTCLYICNLFFLLLFFSS